MMSAVAARTDEPREPGYFRLWRTADIGLSARLSGFSGLMHRNKIRPIRHLVVAAEHRMRYHRIDRDRGFESRRQACRRLVERGFLAAKPSQAVQYRRD
jgi:hypothetical protein